MMLPRSRARVSMCLLMLLGAACNPAAATDPPAPPGQRLGPVLERIQREGRIVLAYRDASVPFSYLDGAGRPIGFALDICLRLVGAIQTRVKRDKLAVDYLPVNSANRFEAIERGRVQLECGSTTSNTVRRERVEFTIPHFITGARLLVRSDSLIDGIDHPQLRRLVSTTQTTPLEAARRMANDRNLSITFIEVAEHDQAVAMVEKGEADAFAMDDAMLYGLKANRPNPAALKVVGRFMTMEPLSIMLAKGDPEFKKLVDDEMRRLIHSQEMRVLYDRWFRQPIAPRGGVLNLAPSYMLQEVWKFPSDRVTF
ncbi:amino acid ABC transporter substrate-binding protein [uncultured Hydrogenophaga sp.]|uniref:amino acid ABC transporter substrate-binding protein n=1 Tax=uncultured Hydrogenophaga sp. TaxID=199683 RepID=UPI00265D7A89|nr:amino acid ABC transporter substrate-binding protein [uncultured Hydrogenophaga sp.]